MQDSVLWLRIDLHEDPTSTEASVARYWIGFFSLFWLINWIGLIFQNKLSTHIPLLSRIWWTGVGKEVHFRAKSPSVKMAKHQVYVSLLSKGAFSLSSSIDHDFYSITEGEGIFHLVSYLDLLEQSKGDVPFWWTNCISVGYFLGSNTKLFC